MVAVPLDHTIGHEQPGGAEHRALGDGGACRLLDLHQIRLVLHRATEAGQRPLAIWQAHEERRASIGKAPRAFEVETVEVDEVGQVARHQQ